VVSDMRLGQPSEEAVMRTEISRGMLAGALDNLPGLCFTREEKSKPGLQTLTSLAKGLRKQSEVNQVV
jgi:hypothetical protein